MRIFIAALAGAIGVTLAAGVWAVDAQSGRGRADAPSPEASFVVAVARATDRFVSDPRRAVMVGRGVCVALAADRSLVVRVVAVPDLSARDTVTVTAAAVEYLCPSQRGKVAAYLGRYS